MVLSPYMSSHWGALVSLEFTKWQYFISIVPSSFISWKTSTERNPLYQLISFPEVQSI